jgi:tryptophanyl-tRNA synthetase
LARLLGREDERAEYRGLLEKGGVGYGDLKKRLADLVLQEFAVMRKKREELAADPAQLGRWMAQGAEKARSSANQVLARVRASVGTN